MKHVPLFVKRASAAPAVSERFQNLKLPNYLRLSCLNLYFEMSRRSLAFFLPQICRRSLNFPKRPKAFWLHPRKIYLHFLRFPYLVLALRLFYLRLVPGHRRQKNLLPNFYLFHSDRSITKNLLLWQPL